MLSSNTGPAKPCNLHGILRIGGHRNFNFSLDLGDCVLVCNTFWKGETLCVSFGENGVNFTEGFNVVNNKQFLEKVQNNCLSIELSKNKDTVNPEIIGSVRLPLHQFYIAYRDASLTNRLSDGNFPVISANKWMPVLNAKSEQIGELECFLAMGTEKQIRNMDNSKVFINQTANNDSTALKNIYNSIPTKNKSQYEQSLPINANISKTSNLISLLQKSLAPTIPDTSKAQRNIQIADQNLFKLHLEIKSARNLPLTQSLKLKKKLNRSARAKGSPNITSQTGEEPSTYVTFQAEEANGALVKSHEGMVYSTTLIEKNSNPIWNASFSISEPVKYFINKHEPFILKIWKKADKSNTNGHKLPCPMEDAIIGFASIDLTDLIKNVSELNRWFDIVDYNGHNNGQIHIVAKRLDNNQVENLLDTFESSLDINNMNLCRAIKRKFTELEEISERLRIRLLDVTDNTDEYKVSYEMGDEQLDEFEHDLNTAVNEDENETLDCHINNLNTQSHLNGMQ